MSAMKKFERFANSKYSGLLLNLFLPGAGHIQFREYAFGLFVFLVCIIAAALFYLSFLIELNSWARLALFGLPLIFYFFTFFDLVNSLKKRKEIKSRAIGFSIAIFMIAIVYQTISPTAPANFVIMNGPQIFYLNDNNLRPVYSQGTFMKASRLAYRLEIVGLNKSIIHELPDRYDIVRYLDKRDQKRNGVILGLPGETIEIVDGTVIINGFPDFEGWIGGITFTGYWPEAQIENDGVLIATLNLGTIDEVYKVPFSRVIGKIEPLFE